MGSGWIKDHPLCGGSPQFSVSAELVSAFQVHSRTPTHSDVMKLYFTEISLEVCYNTLWKFFNNLEIRTSRQLIVKYSLANS